MKTYQLLQEGFGNAPKPKTTSNVWGVVTRAASEKDAKQEGLAYGPKTYWVEIPNVVAGKPNTTYVLWGVNDLELNPSIDGKRTFMVFADKNAMKDHDDCAGSAHFGSKDCAKWRNLLLKTLRGVSFESLDALEDVIENAVAGAMFTWRDTGADDAQR